MCDFGTQKKTKPILWNVIFAPVNCLSVEGLFKRYDEKKESKYGKTASEKPKTRKLSHNEQRELDQLDKGISKLEALLEHFRKYIFLLCMICFFVLSS